MQKNNDFFSPPEEQRKQPEEVIDPSDNSSPLRVKNKALYDKDKMRKLFGG